MVINKILNNNVAVVVEDDEEKIVMGKGICFKKKVDDEIDETMIDKVFALSSQDANHKFQEIIKEVPIEHIILSEKIIQYAKVTLGKRLNEYIYISLVDHMYSAIVRYLEGITVKNALLWDIRRFYRDEYAVGLEALKMIEEEFKVHLPEDEAGFIALHIVNAELDEKSMEDMVAITRIMQEITNIVKYIFNVEFDEDDVYYYRFVTHLKFFAQRLVKHTTYENGDEDDLYELIKTKYKNSTKCVNRIAEFIQRKYDYVLSNEEKLYLTIHIERVIYHKRWHVSIDKKEEWYIYG